MEDGAASLRERNGWADEAPEYANEMKEVC
jgi:hypothetical protein